MTWQDGGSFLGFIGFGVSVVAFVRSRRAMKCEAKVKAESRRLYGVVADAVSGVTLSCEATLDGVKALLREQDRAASARKASLPFSPRIVGRDPEADTARPKSAIPQGALLCPDCGKVHLCLVPDPTSLPRGVCAECHDFRGARA